MKRIKRILKVLGPGFITGAADDDASGVATYAQTGALFGYSQLWTVLFSFPFMVAIQEICARIGLVTGKGLSGVIKHNYPKAILYFVVTILLIANTVNIGADLGAMAASAQLVLGIPFIFLLIGMTILILALEIFVSYPTYAKFLKYLTLSLLAYVIVAFVVKQNWLVIFKSIIIPHIVFSRDYILNIAALLGTTISPYLFFWQADEEVEEELRAHKLRFFGKGIPKINKKDVHEMRLDTTVGMLFSQLITFFIIIAAASTLGAHGITSIQTADQAALALRPIAGDFAYLLFATGIIGVGLIAVPVLAGSASYAVSEAFNWKEGLNKKFKQAHGFYGVMTFATLIGLLVNFTPIKPFTMLYYTAILNSICAPLLMIFIMLIANNKKIMGKYANTIWSNAGGLGITIIMSIVSIFTIVTIIK